METNVETEKKEICQKNVFWDDDDTKNKIPIELIKRILSNDRQLEDLLTLKFKNKTRIYVLTTDNSDYNEKICTKTLLNEV
jgi:hypothetical protein